jgi:hypothetical protein
MPIAVKQLSDSELSAGMVLLDPYLFALYWFQDELTLEPSMEQRLMFCDVSEKVLFCTGRKLAKTVCLESTVLQQLILNESEGGVDEGLFFTPGDAHLIPFVDRIFSRVSREPVLDGIIRARKGENTILESKTLRYYFRVEGMSGSDRNMVGLRAKYIVGDECAFSNEVCHNSRLSTAMPGCKWKYAGVPNGVRNTPFFNLDQTEEGYTWSRHKYSTFINPIFYDKKAQDELARAYGGKKTQGYINNVLGQWGDEVLSSFPAGTIAFHHLPYYVKFLSDISRENELEGLPVRLGIPSIRCGKFCVGVDYGFSPDPTQIIVAYSEEGKEEWNCYIRIELRRVALPRQVDILLYVINNLLSGRFAGLQSDDLRLIQSLQSVDSGRSSFYNWSAPQGTTTVKVLDNGVEKEVKVRNKEYYVTLLKRFFMSYVVGLFDTKLAIGDDAGAIFELSGTTEKKTSAGYTVYFGPTDPLQKRTQVQTDHIRDSLSYLCSAIVASQVSRDDDTSEDELLESLGFVTTGSNAIGNWKPPWAN